MKNNRKKILNLSEKPINYQNYVFQEIQALDNFQAVRYEFYRKIDFKKEKIKKIVIHFNPFLKNINSKYPINIAIKSLTKSLVGELIEFSKHLIYELEEDVEWTETPASKKILKCALKLSFFKWKQFRFNYK
jgi:hypothetical protein